MSSRWPSGLDPRRTGETRVPGGFAFAFTCTRPVTTRRKYVSTRSLKGGGDVPLAILGSLQRELGDLDRIIAWTKVFGMVNSAPGFNRQPAVINGFTDVIIDVFGVDVGAHARSAVGLAELPFDIPVEIEGEVAITP